jgi:acyl-CoA reductase-like NAD-dependent aldehyde dehydrogenase
MHFPIKIPSAKASGRFDVFSPYDGKLVGSVECIAAAGAEIALKNMMAAFNDRSNRLSAHERIGTLERTALTMQALSEQLIAIVIAEGGKPYPDTRVELLSAIKSIRICIECLRAGRGTEIPMQLNQASIHLHCNYNLQIRAIIRSVLFLLAADFV